MEELLNMVKEHLRRQQEAKRYGQARIKEFIETRLKELTSEEEHSPTEQP
jgi:hypothetical protein